MRVLFLVTTKLLLNIFKSKIKLLLSAYSISITVTTISLLFRDQSNSHKKIFCQEERHTLQFIIGIVSESYIVESFAGG